MNNLSQDWAVLVTNTMNKNRIPYSAAWQVCQGEHPDMWLLVAAMGRNRATVNFFNERLAQTVTPERQDARKQFAQYVNEKVAAGMSYNMATNATAREHPEIVAATKSGHGPGYVKITLPGQHRAEFQNEGEMPAPVGSPRQKFMFWLPADADQETFNAAWEGNGSVPYPLNPAKIFAALVSLAQKKNSSLGNDAAIAQVKAKFPRLWEAVQTLANEPI